MPGPLVCQRPCVQHLNTEKKPTFRQLGSTKIQKPALCCLLFHKFFPYPLPFCGLDWLCYSHCANVQEKPNGSPAQKHYSALWWAPGPAHPVHISHLRPTVCPALCVCSHTDESRGRAAGRQVAVKMPCPITSNVHTRQQRSHPPGMMWCFKSALITKNCLQRSDQAPLSLFL